jgi:hypothetical protein
MYVYMLKILHNGWNIDLILKLQRFNAVKQIYITLNNIKKKKKKKKKDTMKTVFLCRRVTYAHL